MPVVKCPSCSRALSVGDDLAGASVRCPACKTVFRTPAAAPQPPPAAPVPRPLAAPALAATDDPFDSGGGAAKASPDQAVQFDESPDEGYERVRVRARTAAAANWLSWGCFLFFFDSISVFIAVVTGASGFQLSRSSDITGLMIAFLVLFVLVALFVYAPLTVIALGARSLRTQWSYGLAMTGAVLAVIVCVPTLLGGAAWILLLLYIIAVALLHLPLAALLLLIPLFAAIILLATGVSFLTGAISAFRALADREVSEAFRSRSWGG